MKCYYCEEEIKDEEYCSLNSYLADGSLSNSDSWHRECFKTWLEEKVDNRVKQLAQGITKMIPMAIGGLN